MARKLGLTRARVTQLLDLLLLAPDLQQTVLALEVVGGAEPMSERALRAVAWRLCEVNWKRQPPLRPAVGNGAPR